ncbi:MAG TPA: hypothetical protein VGC38_02810 [Pseudolabrys sp.]
MKPTPSFLDQLKAAADGQSAAEDAFRRDIAARVKAMENERAFAFRRLNLMRAIAEVVADAEGEEIAVAAATAVLRAKLGWSDDSEVRDAVVSRFAPVAVAIYASLSPETAAAPDKKETAPPDVLAALGEFETWYAQTHPHPFWVLFEVYMPETPRVDF